MKFFAISAILVNFLFFPSCATLEISDFRETGPPFNPVEFFQGHTSSRGVLENRGGHPLEIVETRTEGRKNGDVLRIEQDLTIGGENSHRSWQLSRLDENTYQATANDIVGTARGQAYGNAFHWSFLLEGTPGNPLTRIRMSQWMYLQPGGRTMVNHTTFSRFGINLAQVTEQFRIIR